MTSHKRNYIILKIEKNERKRKKKMEKKALIFGHKNPDTDSICSSMVHETLNKKVGWDAKAVRIGNINKETRICFELFRN